MDSNASNVKRPASKEVLRPEEISLPQSFQVKYLGRRPSKGLWGIKHTRYGFVKKTFKNCIFRTNFRLAKIYGFLYHQLFWHSFFRKPVDDLVEAAK